MNNNYFQETQKLSHMKSKNKKILQYEVLIKKVFFFK